MAISKHRGLREHSHGKDLFFDFFYSLSFPLLSSQLFKHIMQKLGKNKLASLRGEEERVTKESVKKGSSWKRKKSAWLTPTWILFSKNVKQKRTLYGYYNEERTLWEFFTYSAGWHEVHSMGFFNKAAKRKRDHFLV